jgi:hypothetical protein
MVIIDCESCKSEIRKETAIEIFKKLEALKEEAFGVPYINYREYQQLKQEYGIDE